MNAKRAAAELLSCLVLVLAPVAPLEGAELVNVTNSVWSYYPGYTNLSTEPWMELDYPDAESWPTGRGLFAAETAVYPYPFNTPLLYGQEGGPFTYYFRTLFPWENSVPDHPILVTTNYADDGYVMYLNGVEIHRYNLPAGPMSNITSALASNPLGEPVVYPWLVPLDSLAAPLLAGENILAVELHDGGVNGDKVWGVQADVVSGRPPEFLAPTEAQLLHVMEGDSCSLEVAINGFPEATLQWEFSSDAGFTFQSLTNEVSMKLTIPFMTMAEVGWYRCRASNLVGTALSPIFDVQALPRDVPPTVLSTCANPEGTTIEVTFDIDIIINGDPILYLVLDAAGNVRRATNLVVHGRILLMQGLVDASTGDVMPLEAGVPYQFDFLQGVPFTVADIFGNELPPNTASEPVYGVPATLGKLNSSVIFQEGVNGYTGTEDTEVRFSNPDANLGENVSINTDGSDGGGAVHGLIRFNHIMGSSGIPGGATILSATLSFWTTEEGTPVNLHRMLTDWNEASTWNGLVAGVQADDLEAVSVADAQIITAPAHQFHTVDVRNTIQTWVDGSDGSAPNYGWALLPTGGDGWDFASSESAMADLRPSLKVCYELPDCMGPPEIIAQPQDAIFFGGGGELVSFAILDLCGMTYQWRHNGVEIPGANSSRIEVVLTCMTEGNYDVEVSNGFGSVVSESASLCCGEEGSPPELISTVGNGDTGSVILSFTEPILPETATNLSNYHIAIVGGGTLPITNVGQLASPSQVVLQVAPDMNQRYALSISNLTDLALCPNPVFPVTVPLVFAYRMLDWDARWSFATNGADAPVPGWQDPDFEDGGWLTGHGLFGLETSGGTPIPQPPGIQTPFTLTNELGNWLWTFYFRTGVNVGITDTSDVTFEFNHIIDDGGVVYVDGSETFRINMTADGEGCFCPAPVAYTNVADMAGEAALLTNTASLVSGDNSVAVEVHQANEGSSDILFGLQIVAQVGRAPEVGANLRIRQDASTVTIQWDDPSSILLAAPAPEGPYLEVVGASSPHTFDKSAVPRMRFFKAGRH